MTDSTTGFSQSRTAVPPSTRTLRVPGATLTYDVREPGRPATARPVLLVGSPMGAQGFGTLAGHLADRVVVTYDPRGVERSTVDPDVAPATPFTHADDLHRLVAEVGGGPVDVFASSGGAVNALAWVQSHPQDVATLVAHEPPVPGVLPDAELVTGAMADLHDTYVRDGWAAAMAGFMVLVSHEGPLPADYRDRPAPDPAAFGLPAGDDGSRDDPMFAVNMLTLPRYVPDAAAIRSAPTRVVVGVGAESGEQMAARAARAIAALLGDEPVVLPGGHGGFLGGEYGQTGAPDAFGAALREVLGRLLG